MWALVAVAFGVPVGMLVGFLALVGCIVVFGWYFGTNYQIVCKASGFSVTTSSRAKGTHRHDYRWSEVIETEYSVRTDFETRSIVIAKYFGVKTTWGETFTVTDGLSGFHDLIQLFNQMTPHLPYTWEKHYYGWGGWDYRQITRQITRPDKGRE